MAKVQSSGIAKAGMVTGITGTALGALAVGKELYDTFKPKNAANTAQTADGSAVMPGVIGVPIPGNTTQTGNKGASAMNLGGYLASTDAALALQGAAFSKISELQADIGRLSAERYADQVAAGVYDRAAAMSNRNDEKINANLKDAFSEIIVTREKLARAEVREECNAKEMARMSDGLATVQREIAEMRVREQATSDAINCLAKSTEQRFSAVYKEIDCTRKETGAALALESERREAGDNNIMCYVRATYVPGRLVMPKDSICPEVMQRWNSWTAPTGEAPATQPVSGSVNVRMTQ
ncbi:MAG: hypothetical protein NC112_05745 [Oxalobacter formigenes]|nr:hypothetical protein [Oxalobacter formigenes]